MLCSISTGKSSSKWLDRLRSTKGFPAGDDLDLEHFLNNHNPNLSNSLDPKLTDANIGPTSEKPVLDRNRTTDPAPRENGEKEWLGVMSSVLAELFNMGESDDFHKIHGKKGSRKQPNPRICVVSTPSDVEGKKNDASSGDNSCAEMKRASDRSRLMKEENADVDVGTAGFEEDEKSHGDLLGFSRTEVTVIDSSCPAWKCEKLLFRRKNVWKVREKKSRSTTNIRIRKRKANALEEESLGGEKKPKRCDASKDADGGRMMQPNNVHLQSDEMNNGRKERPEIVRFPRKSKKCGSSVILVKSVPTSKKNGANNAI